MKILTKSHKIIFTSVFLLSATLMQSTYANTNSPSFDNKQDRQASRIHQGIASGALTEREANRLGYQQEKLVNREERFKSDGQFTKRERAVIHRDLFRTSHSIYRQKHDAQAQGKARPFSVSSRKHVVNKRQVNQVKRIKGGVRSGQLTRDETIRLGKQQRSINQQKRHFKADGKFTKKERFVVHKRQNRASKNIFRKKHNNRKR